MNSRWTAPLFALGLAAMPGLARAQIRITVDPSADRGAVNREVFGADLEFISNNSPEVRAVAQNYAVWRFPGGDADSVFQWDQPLDMPCARMGVDWPTAATWASASGAAMFLETNIVQSSAANAAMWVADAQRRGVRVSWVGIGNEVWGDWDRGYRSPSTYAANVRAHAAAIRAVAPDARIVLSIGTRNEDAWNRAALRLAADVIDAVDYHYYPNHQDGDQVRAAEVVAGAEGIAPLLARLRAMIRTEAPARADRIGVVIGEWDGAADPPRAPGTPVPGHAYAQWSMSNALFHGAALGEMLVGGVSAAMMYEVQGYRFGAAPGDRCADAPANLRRPKHLVDKLWRDHLGDRIVGVTATSVPTYHVTGPTNWDGYAGDVPYVRAYATTADGGASLRVVVVNRGSADDVPTVQLSLRAFDPDPRATLSFVGGGTLDDTNENVDGAEDAVHLQTQDLTVTGADFAFAPPPYSVSVIELRRRGSVVTDGGLRDATTTDVPTNTDVPAGQDARAPSDVTTAGDVTTTGDATTGAGATSAGCGCVAGDARGLRGGWALALAGAVIARRRRRTR